MPMRPIANGARHPHRLALPGFMTHPLWRAAGRRVAGLCLILSATSCVHTRTPRPEDWATSVGNRADFIARAQAVPDDDIFEVRTSRLMTAVYDLEKAPVMLLTPEMARYYIGAGYRSREGTRPFLVRGLFANYTGNHSAYLLQDSLLVVHASLGYSFRPHFCPLVVNLQREPRTVFVVVGGTR